MACSTLHLSDADTANLLRRLLRGNRHVEVLELSLESRAFGSGSDLLTLELAVRLRVLVPGIKGMALKAALEGRSIRCAVTVIEATNARILLGLEPDAATAGILSLAATFASALPPWIAYADRVVILDLSRNAPVADKFAALGILHGVHFDASSPDRPIRIDFSI